MTVTRGGSTCLAVPDLDSFSSPKSEVGGGLSRQHPRFQTCFFTRNPLQRVFCLSSIQETTETHVILYFHPYPWPMTAGLGDIREAICEHGLHFTDPVPGDLFGTEGTLAVTTQRGMRIAS